MSVKDLRLIITGSMSKWICTANFIVIDRPIHSSIHHSLIKIFACFWIDLTRCILFINSDKIFQRQLRSFVVFTPLRIKNRRGEGASSGPSLPNWEQNILKYLKSFKESWPCSLHMYSNSIYYLYKGPVENPKESICRQTVWFKLRQNETTVFRK